MDRELSKKKPPRDGRFFQWFGLPRRTGPADCECREDAEGYFEQRLSEEAINSFEAHLLGCPVCVAKLEAMLVAKSEVASLADQIRGLPDPADVPRFAWWKLTSIAACAAIIVAAISISIYTKKNSAPLVASRTPSAPSSTQTAREGAPLPSDKTNVPSTEKQHAADNLPLNGRNYTNFSLPNSSVRRNTAPKVGPAPSSGLNVSGARAPLNVPSETPAAASSATNNDGKPVDVAKSRPKAQPRGDSNEAPKLTAEQGVELYHLANVVAPPFTFTGFTNNSTVSGQGTSSSHSPSRQAVDTGRTVFRKAMTAYVEGNYGESAELLEQAQEKEPLALDVQFYLGVCRLLIGQPQAAIEPLQRAASVKGPMLQQQAHYFLAKAYLQGMQFKEAEEELKAAAELTGPLKADSAALLKRLRALRAQLENN